MIGEELQIDPANVEASFAVNALGGNESNGSVYFNFWSSGAAADRWQALSPVKGDAAGTIILNRLTQRGFRAETRQRARNQDRRYAKFCRQIVNYVGGKRTKRFPGASKVKRGLI